MQILLESEMSLADSGALPRESMFVVISLIGQISSLLSNGLLAPLQREPLYRLLTYALEFPSSDALPKAEEHKALGFHLHLTITCVSGKSLVTNYCIYPSSSYLGVCSKLSFWTILYHGLSELEGAVEAMLINCVIFKRSQWQFREVKCPHHEPQILMEVELD